MFGLIRKYWGNWQAAKLRRAEETIRGLKIRYHTFRIILINNDRALELVNAIDLRLKRKSQFRQDLENQVEELLGVCYELLDGLNRLGDGQHLQLYELHKRLSELIRKALPEVSRKSGDCPYCLFLDEITPEMKKMVGGKAGSLSDLKKISLPVPNGFVITIEACQEFLRANDIEKSIRRRLRRLETDQRYLRDLEAIVREIREMILSGILTSELENAFRSAYVRLTGLRQESISVRSSAGVEDQTTHSFAGQFKTVLNVTSFEDMIEAFKQVLASNFNTRSIFYRFHAGLPLTDFDMAVLCQIIIKARTAGVLFTVDPAVRESERMLVSAVAGLGSLAVGGEARADLYRPLRSAKETEIPAEIVEKTYKEVCSPGGGIHREEVPPAERFKPLLSREEIHSLADFGLIIESFTGKPQDIEWAVNEDGMIYILQSRPFRLSRKGAMAPETIHGEVLFQGGIASSSGRSIGRTKIIHSARDLEGIESGPVIAVLHQSLVEAARSMHHFSGIVVDKGNPADHLSNVAREFGIPMLTRTEKASRILQNDQWIVLDADRSIIFLAPQEALHGLPGTRILFPSPEISEVEALPDSHPSKHLQDLIVRLNLTDAYGPAFSIWECRSLHDLIRYVHEMAVLTMFKAGDEVMEQAGNFIHRLDGEINFHFLIIDMGGGLVPGLQNMKINPADILSIPLLALWKGASSPGLRWNAPPPAAALSGLFGRSLTDGRSLRPLGNCNYALIAKDYLNMNARLEFHFTMVDTVCGVNPKDNYIRFRFKGGGTTQIQKERRARFIAEVLEAHDFFTDRRGDLVTGTIMEMSRGSAEERLVMLGRLLGFSRLMDAMMHNDESPGIMARAFLDGNYALDGIHPEKNDAKKNHA
jgi:pyruvate, water dikinase